MTDKIYVSKLNDAYIRVDSDDRGILRELSETLTFQVPGYQFMPKYRNGVWDGKIRLLSYKDQSIYAGLTYKLDEFCAERGYDIEYGYDTSTVNFSLNEASEFSASLNLPFKPYDYQLDAFVHGVRHERALFESPTASGKSLIMYLLMRYYTRPTLIIVPTTTLIHQLYSDFEEYGFDSEEYIHKIYSGQPKQTDKPIILSTWQSIYKLKEPWFSQFELVLGDEAHFFKGPSLISIMTKLKNCPYRFGLSGTVTNEDSQVHQWVLEGLFGRKEKVITTKELMDSKRVADLKIKIITLSHTPEEKKTVAKLDYQGEMDYLVSHNRRNKFIRNLALSLKGNTLILFQYVDKHGRLLYNDIKEQVKDDRKVFFIHGAVSGDERDAMRHIVENETDAIIIASYGTLSTGISIKNLHNLMFASPSKSRIRNLQSIGRSLRISNTKSDATLYDISDDLIHGSEMNTTLRHLMERIKIYDKEQFEYKLYKVKL